MIPYAAYTTNARSLKAVREAGWRVLLSPATGLKNYGIPYALDNGAWSAFVAGQPFNEEAFRTAVGKIGVHAAWVVAPDIVEGGLGFPRFDALILSFVACGIGLESAFRRAIS